MIVIEKDRNALTPAEMDTLVHLCEGLSNKLIADRLDISVHTAKFHIDNIMRKMGVSTRTAVAVQAIRKGLVK